MRKHLAASITYTLLIAMVLGWAHSATAQLECIPGVATVINGSVGEADPDQTTRVFRSGTMRATTCLSNPAITGSPIAGTFNHDVHPITSAGAGCVTVRVDTACQGVNNIFVVAYSSFDPGLPNTNVIGHLGASPAGTSGGPAYFSYPIGVSGMSTIVVSEAGTPGTGCGSYTLTVTYKSGCRQSGFDRNNDGTADYAVFRPGAPARYFNMPAAESAIEQRPFGTTGDIPVHGDYVGDGATDIAVHRPGAPARTYYANDQAVSTYSAITWGTTGDLPVVGDWDGDGRHDACIFRPSTGAWYILRSGDGTTFVYYWGTSTDTPLTGDYDGDMRTDFAVVRPTGANNFWYVLLSNFNYMTALTDTGVGSVQSDVGVGVMFGMTSDKLVPADYDGDGRTDLAVWRDSVGDFFVRQMPGGGAPSMTSVHWGAPGDIPQPADYDGDKKHDFAIYRPVFQGAYWARMSSNGGLIYAKIGTTGDVPVSAPYRVQ